MRLELIFEKVVSRKMPIFLFSFILRKQGKQAERDVIFVQLMKKTVGALWLVSVCEAAR